MQKILIATTNPGKFTEFVTEMKDLPFTIIDLRVTKLDTFEVDEPFNTTAENALHKAKFYAQKSGLVTIAEDTGLFIRALNGKPGVHTKRFAPTPAERIKKILTLLKNTPEKKRTAYFETSACVYNPKTESYTMFKGKVVGKIAKKAAAKARPGMEHDAFFFYPPAKKLFIHMSPEEKNLVSHRGQVINQIKYFLGNEYRFKQFIVPLALVVKNRKLLLLKRRDHRKSFNNKWEFPGGGVENGETLEQCLLRECTEETGLKVKILERLPSIPTMVMGEKYRYQIFLVGFVCGIRSGAVKTMDNESHEHAWFTLSAARKANLLPLNKKCIQVNIKTLKNYFD